MVTVVGYSENVVCVNDPRVQQSPWRYKKDEFERARMVTDCDTIFVFR